MPLKKLLLKPGIDRENTSYTSEGGWYDGDKIRFRQGTPEKIGGWSPISIGKFFLGICRSLWNWTSLTSVNFTGVGTNIKFYIEMGSAYYDITPLRLTTAAGDVTFSASNGSPYITVTEANHAAIVGDFVTFSGAVGLGGNITAGVLNQEYSIVSVISSTQYTIMARAAGVTISDITTQTGLVPFPSSVTATGSDSGNGGSNTVAAYQINIGVDGEVPITGYGAGTWGEDAWDHSTLGSTISSLRMWSQGNFGEDLILGYKGSPLYYWDASNGLSTRCVLLSSLAGASNVPTAQNFSLVSDNRFVFCFGTNPQGSATLDPMLVRWSDQDNPVEWGASALTQAGDMPLSRGTELMSAIQARQEILVWSDSALYSFQYVGVDSGVWGSQILGDNISIISKNAVAYSSGIAFWMGKDKFYKYDGTVAPLPCKVRKYVFDDINKDQFEQVFSGTVESFNEVWWFYCSKSSSTIDRYVVFNYLDNIWYYGTLNRTAWLDAPAKDFPLAATYKQNIVNHESGTDDNELGEANAITAHISSAEFDLDDGHQFMFVHRVLPDIRFDGTLDGTTPSATLSLLPLANSGSGYNNPLTFRNNNQTTITRSAATQTVYNTDSDKNSVPPQNPKTYNIEQYTGQLNVRARGRQMVMKVESSGLGVQWQLGSPRLDMRPDGRR